MAFSATVIAHNYNKTLAHTATSTSVLSLDKVSNRIQMILIVGNIYQVVYVSNISSINSYCKWHLQI